MNMYVINHVNSEATNYWVDDKLGTNIPTAKISTQSLPTFRLITAQLLCIF